MLFPIENHKKALVQSSNKKLTENVSLPLFVYKYLHRTQFFNLLPDWQFIKCYCKNKLYAFQILTTCMMGKLIKCYSAGKSIFFQILTTCPIGKLHKI